MTNRTIANQTCPIKSRKYQFRNTYAYFRLLKLESILVSKILQVSTWFIEINTFNLWNSTEIQFCWMKIAKTKEKLLSTYQDTWSLLYSFSWRWMFHIIGTRSPIIYESVLIGSLWPGDTTRKECSRGKNGQLKNKNYKLFRLSNGAHLHWLKLQLLQNMLLYFVYETTKSIPGIELSGNRQTKDCIGFKTENTLYFGCKIPLTAY